ncbi:MAG: hypothetical protein V1872_12125 [bacterium]
MYQLNLLALVIGIIIVITRLPTVIWPEQASHLCDRFLSKLYLLRTIGIILFGAGSYIIYLLLRKSNLLDMTMIVIGVFWLLIGIWVIVKPEGYQRYGKYLLGRSEFTIRLLSLLLVVFGIFLIFLAVFSRPIALM